MEKENVATAPRPAPIQLTIDLDVVDGPRTPPASLLERLNKSPTCKSPLAKTQECRVRDAGALRDACLQDKIERAHRVGVRRSLVFDNRAKQERVTAEKLHAKLQMTDAKAQAVKEATEARALAIKTRREASAASVAQARADKEQERQLRSAALLSAEKHASLKRDKVLQSVIDRSGGTFKKAIGRAKEVKAKEAEATALAGEALTLRLQAAESRRLDALMKAPPSPQSQSPTDVLHRVLNDNKVERGYKRRSLEAAMVKATSNREARLTEITSKAREANARATSVAAAIKQEATGGAGAKGAQHYEKMVAAEVARSAVLRQRQAHLPANAKVKPAELVVIVPMGTCRTPPWALLRRLSIKGSGLVATAAARQAAAALRRKAMAVTRSAAVLRRQLKAEAARANRAAAAAANADALGMRTALSAATLAGRARERAANVATMHEKARAAAAHRAALGAVKKAKDTKAAERCAAASRRYHLTLRRIAEQRVSHGRVAKNVQRRDAAAVARTVKGAADAARSLAATQARTLILQGRVATARRFLPAKLVLKEPIVSTPEKLSREAARPDTSAPLTSIPLTPPANGVDRVETPQPAVQPTHPKDGPALDSPDRISDPLTGALVGAHGVGKAVFGVAVGVVAAAGAFLSVSPSK